MLDLPSAIDRRAVIVAVAQLGIFGLLAQIAPVGAPLASVALLVAALLAGLSPTGGLAATVVTLPFFYHPIGVADSEFATSELLLIAAAAGCALRAAWKLAQSASRWRPIAESYLASLASARYVLLLVTAVAVGAVLVVWPFDVSARGASLREWRWTLLEPLLFVALLTLFVRTAERRLVIVGAFIVSSAAIAVVGIVDVAEGGGVAAESVRRLSAPFPHPNAFALYALRATVFTLALWAFAPRMRWWLTAPAVLSASAVLGSFSRGALVALFVGLLCIGWRFGWRRQMLIVIGAAAVAGVLLIIAGGRMLSAFEGGSVTLRGDIWSAAVRMIRDRPVTGFGLDQFYYAYNPRYVTPTGWPERFTSHAHNLLLDAWVRLGIIGAGLVVVATGSVARRTISVATERFKRDQIAAAALIALAALLVHGMVDNAYFGHDLAMSAWLLAWLAYGVRAPKPAGGAL